MLSRLRMTVEDCITEYANLGGGIFGKPRHFHELIRPLYWINRTKYDPKKFVKVINDVTERRGKRGSGSRFESDADLCRTLVGLSQLSLYALTIKQAYLRPQGRREQGKNVLRNTLCLPILPTFERAPRFRLSKEPGRSLTI